MAGNKIKIRGVLLNLNNAAHLTDHLAAMAAIMGMPLLFTDPEVVEFAKKWYPDVECRLENWENVNPVYYAKHYDLLFQSDLFSKEKLKLVFEAFRDKNRPLHNVQVPHGFSDKIFWFKHLVDEDIVLLYGDNMLDMLKGEGLFDKLGPYVITGNYRYSYYKKHREFLNLKIKNEVLFKFQGRKARRTIIYAPTWNDFEGSSSFYSMAPILFDKLSPEDNLIVKLHPKIEAADVGELIRIIGMQIERPNVVVLSRFPPVFPLLNDCDLYIGDMSSVGYDYLAFNRPMYFLNERNRNSKSDKGLYLYRCGIEVMPEDYKNIYTIIEDSLPYDKANFQDIRNEVYQYSFGDEKPFEQIKSEILDLCQ